MKSRVSRFVSVLVGLAFVAVAITQTGCVHKKLKDVCVFDLETGRLTCDGSIRIPGLSD